MRKLLIVLCVIVVCLSLSLYFGMFHGSLSDSSEEFSRFGDYVGGTIGATMALLSAYLVFITYRQQVEFSKEQMELSRRTQFENNFFQLLQVQRDIAKTLVVKRRDTMRPTRSFSHIGEDALYHVAEDIKQAMLELTYMTEEIDSMNFEQLRRKIDAIFSHAVETYGEQSLSHYYRHLFHILKFVKTSEVAKIESYLSIVQAQMTNDELYILFFDALSKYGYPKLYRIVAEYGMLENLHYHDFDYFKILQRKCYPDTYFKYSPNNAILITGYFGKLRESTLIQLSQQFNASLIDVESMNYWHRDNIRIKIIGGESIVVKHLSDALHSDTLYLFDSSFVTSNGKPIDSSVFKELNPMAVIICEDDVESIDAKYKEYGHQRYKIDYIMSIIKEEKRTAKMFCENNNIPFIICGSEDYQSMCDFISGYSLR